MGILRTLYSSVNVILLAMPEPMRNIVISVISRLPFSLIYPRVFMIEPTNACNGLCPLCPVGAKIDERRKGQMDYRSFVVLVDEIKGFAKLIIMNFAGEPLLNKDVHRMAAYAESNGIRTIIGTNGTLDKSEELVASGVSEILFSLDGATEESYRQYRTYKDGTRHDEVLANLTKIVEKKRELRSAKPTIILQFVVFKHNEHEIGQIITLARNIGVDGIDFKPVCINDFFTTPLSALIETFAPKENGLSYMHEVDARVSKPPWCSFSFYQTQILWNGDVTTCCYDFDGDHVVGNVITDGGFKNVWKNKQYRDKRRRIITQDLGICEKCDETLARPARMLFNMSAISEIDGAELSNGSKTSYER